LLSGRPFLLARRSRAGAFVLPGGWRRRCPTDDDVAVALAGAAQRGEAVDRGLVQPNDRVALVARTVGLCLRVRRQSRFDRRIGFGGDRNADPGTTSQRGLTPHVCWVSDVRRYDNRSVISGGSEGTMTIALVFELCGGVLALTTIAFLALASASRSMPDLEREATLEAVLFRHRSGSK
jgi:hypothetical protein